MAVNATETFLMTQNVTVTVIFSIIVTGTLFTNILVLVISHVAKCVEKNDHAVYLVSLAVADLLVGVSSTPIIVEAWLPLDNVMKTHLVCLVKQIFVSIGVTVSVLLVGLLSIVQYCAMKAPFFHRTHLGKTFAVMSSIVIWLFSSVTITLIFVQLSDNTIERLDICHASKLFGENKKTFNFILIVCFGLVFTVIVSLNISTFIFLKLREIKREGITSAPAYRMRKRALVMYDENTGSTTMEQKGITQANKTAGRGRSVPHWYQRSSSDLFFTRTRDNNRKGSRSKKPRSSDPTHYRQNSQRHVSQTQQHVIRRKRSVRPYITIASSGFVFTSSLLPYFVLTILETVCEDCVNVRLLWYVFFAGVVINSMVNPLLYAFRLTVYNKYLTKKLKCFKTSRIPV